jgi:hypothetical protein
MRVRSLVLVGLLAGAAVLGRLAPAAPGDAFTDPAQAGPDYAVQGEFSGGAGDGKLGAQVIALGKDTFQAVFLAGGLPGDGWDGRARPRAEGRRTGDSVAFEGGGWEARLTGDELRGKDPSGAAFRLNRVQRRSPTEGAKPPAGAVVLFDGMGVEHWDGGKMTADGLLECGSRTRRSFRDFTLHLEFRTPFKPEARGQSRGNSGLYIFGRYEIQILDSFGLEGRNNECGAVYQQRPPAVNMCFPPLAWQTYDLDFQAPRFDGKTKTRNARLTLRHNGVVVHDGYELPNATGGGARIGENLAEGPLVIQNHGNPVRLRNIWVVER